MKFGTFGAATIYLAALAVLSQINQPPYLAAVAGVAVILSQGLALWGYERRKQMFFASGILVGFIVLPVLVTALSLGLWVNSLLYLPVAVLQLDLGLKRLAERPV